MAQKNRTETLEAFKNDEITLLVCSDVAGRGIDVDDLSHVFNFDVPMNADDYVHRIGRTGRAGKTGRAWMLATRNEDKYLDAIQKLTKQKLTVKEIGGQAAQKDEKPEKKDNKRKDSGKKTKSEDASGQKNQPVSQKTQNESKGKGKRRKSEDGDGDKVKGFGDEIPNFFGS